MAHARLNNASGCQHDPRHPDQWGGTQRPRQAGWDRKHTPRPLCFVGSHWTEVLFADRCEWTGGTLCAPTHLMRRQKNG